MRLVVISIGRLKQGPERELSERYRERFNDISRKLGFRGVEIHEIPESRARDGASRMAAWRKARLLPRRLLAEAIVNADNVAASAMGDPSHR